jgi:hypothetical protein
MPEDFDPFVDTAICDYCQGVKKRKWESDGILPKLELNVDIPRVPCLGIVKGGGPLAS